MREAGASETRATKPDLGTVMAVSAVTAFVLVMVLIIISAPWPGVLWHGQLGDSQLLIGTLGALTGLIAGMALRGKPIVATLVAFLLAFGIYGVVQGIAYRDATNPGRHARAEAAKWPLLVSEEYTKPVPIPSAADQGGEVSVTVQDGRLVLAVSSHRDFTGQMPPAPQRPTAEQPVVRDFYLQADVELTEGPQDGFCGLLFGWKGNEHWYAMKVGQSGLQVTQNPGTVPHTRLFGTIQHPALKMSSPNQLGILAHGGEVRFYVNDRQVSLLHVGDTTGQILVAAQAANTPDVLRCAFGHVRLWGPKLPHDLLGGLELDSYCQSRAYVKATLTSPQIGSNAARRNWACTSGETPQLIDIDGACRWQYRRSDAVGWADNDDDAYTWKCFASA